jgi:transposase-like protein
MPRTHPPYPPEFRRQIVELAWEFEPSCETICQWIR